MRRAALREGLLVGIVVFLVLTVVLSVIDAIGSTEFVAIALIATAAGVVTNRRDRPGSAAPGR